MLVVPGASEDTLKKKKSFKTFLPAYPQMSRTIIQQYIKFLNRIGCTIPLPSVSCPEPTVKGAVVKMTGDYTLGCTCTAFPFVAVAAFAGACC